MSDDNSKSAGEDDFDVNWMRKIYRLQTQARHKLSDSPWLVKIIYITVSTDRIASKKAPSQMKTIISANLK